MPLSTLPGPKRTLLIVKQLCSKCKINSDHMLLRRWTEESGNSDTLIKAESWVCCYCDTIHEKRSEEPKPTDETMIVRRLLKLSGDYEQIRHSTLEVEGDKLTLTLKLFPWDVVQAARRVEEAKPKGFYRLGDLWRLEQHGLLQSPLIDAEPSSCRVENSEPRTQTNDDIADQGWT